MTRAARDSSVRRLFAKLSFDPEIAGGTPKSTKSAKPAAIGCSSNRERPSFLNAAGAPQDRVGPGSG
jgi:hypothetical protein